MSLWAEKLGRRDLFYASTSGSPQLRLRDQRPLPMILEMNPLRGDLLPS